MSMKMIQLKSRLKVSGTGVLAASHVTVSGGPVTLAADVEASALLPGMDAPFDLGGARLSLTWNDIGPIGPGQSKEVSISMKVGDDSGAGRFVDTAVATGLCGPASAQGSATASGGAEAVPLEGRVVLNLPEVTAVLGRSLPATLPRTGGLGLGLLPALSLLAAGSSLNRLSRRRSS